MSIIHIVKIAEPLPNLLRRRHIQSSHDFLDCYCQPVVAFVPTPCLAQHQAGSLWSFLDIGSLADDDDDSGEINRGTRAVLGKCGGRILTKQLVRLGSWG